MIETNNLFAYGTLMWPEVLEGVIGRRLKGRPATLTGFLRLRVIGEHYPAVIPSPGDEVDGLLYDGLTDTDFRHLDRFEGEEYDRVTVCIGHVSVEVYVLAAQWRHLAEEKPWRPEQMLAEHLAAFREEYKGWHDIPPQAGGEI